jgi:dolichyl-phosphate beta-glucosyltransferase
MSQNPFISIILPSYRGSAILDRQLPDFLAYLKVNNIDAELIIVDDGSIDEGLTREVAVKNNVKYLEQDRNKGKGAAVRRGILESSGLYCFFTDIDIPFEYDAFASFLSCLTKDNYDIVVGDRTLPDSTYFTQIGLIRKLGSDIFSFLVSHLFTDGLHDTQCGMKAFKREVAIDLFSHSRINGFAFDVEIISIAVKRKYQLKRLPVKFRCNDSKSVKVVKHGMQMLYDTLRILIFHQLKYYRIRDEKKN